MSLPEPQRVLFIVSTGRAGSVFLQSLFDGHPQVFGYPAIVGWYLGPVHRRTYRDVDELLYVLEHFGRVRQALRGEPQFALGGLGPGGTQHLTIDGARFLPLIRDELRGVTGVIHRRDAIIAVHRAWARYEGRAPDDLPVMLEHVHSPAALDEALTDFPGALTVNMVRDPRIALDSFIDRYLEVGGHLMNTDFLDVADRFWAAGWELMARPPSPGLRHVQLEALHHAPEETMRELAAWLGIEFHPSLLTSTIAGLASAGNSSVRKQGGFSKAMVDPARLRKLGRVSLWRTEGLLRAPMQAAGYEPLLEDSAFNRVMGRVAPWLPVRREFSWDVRAFLGAARREDAFTPQHQWLGWVLTERWPALSPWVQAAGLREEASLAGRTLRPLLTTALGLKRFAVDQLTCYAARVRRFSKLRRTLRGG